MNMCYYSFLEWQRGSVLNCPANVIANKPLWLIIVTGMK